MEKCRILPRLIGKSPVIFFTTFESVALASEIGFVILLLIELKAVPTDVFRALIFEVKPVLMPLTTERTFVLAFVIAVEIVVLIFVNADVAVVLILFQAAVSFAFTVSQFL